MRALMMVFGLGLGLAWVSAGQAAPVAPVFQVQACCSLCPTAALDNSYDVDGRTNYRRLIEARDDWMFRSDVDLRTDFGLDEYGNLELLRLRNALKRKGVDLLVVYQPSRGLLHADRLNPADRAGYDLDKARSSYASTLAQLRKGDILVPDMTRLFDAPKDTPAYFFKGDVHWTPDGAKRAAELVTQTIHDAPDLANLPKAQFVSQPGNLAGRRGSLHRVAEEICGTGYADQWFQSYVTHPASNAKEPQADVVLVGGSNENAVFNFAGFLEQDLGTPVRNLSVASTGYSGALMQYLLSSEFVEHPPRLVILEVDDVDPLQERNFYRQAVPAVSGGCSGQPALLQSHNQLHPGANQVLFNGLGGVKPIKGSDYRIDLQFADPKVTDVSAVLTYMNGRQESINLTRLPTPDGKGRFLLELRADANWSDMTLLAMTIEQVGQPTGDAGLDAQVCQAHDGAAPALHDSKLSTAQASVQ